MSLPSHHFELLEASMLGQVRQWRNSPRIRAQARHADLISAKAQQQWFESLSCDPARQYLIFYQQELPIGVLAFTNIDQASSQCEWGGYIGAERCWPGTGIVLEGAALDYAFFHLKLDRVNAEVFVDNKGPQRTHALFGFNAIGVVGEAGGRELMGFYHTKNDWSRRRANVLRKLPDKVAKAIDAVQFRIPNHRSKI